MMKSAIVGLVEFCTGRPLWIVVLAVALAGGSAFYAARHFAIKTNVNDLISRDQPWTQRGIQFLNDFPQRDIIIVVDAPTPELVEQASAKLAAALRQRPDRLLIGVDRGEIKLDDLSSLCPWQPTRLRRFWPVGLRAFRGAPSPAANRRSRKTCADSSRSNPYSISAIFGPAARLPRRSPR